ncbi:MAG TPA: DEAD/DEAH box helicase [Solirubrobacterales bacterium]|nr:DEAD/DEAH box helicase [Solirubrobacterales bacterium]
MTAADRIDAYVQAFDSQGGDRVLGRAELAFFSELLDAAPRSPLERDEIDANEVAWGFESLALASQGETSDDEIIRLFDTAFRVRASTWKHDEAPRPIDLWMLVVSGLCAQKQPELRLTLQRTDLDLPVPGDASWSERLWIGCVRSFALSARKASSWEDIEESFAAVEALAREQVGLSATTDDGTGHEFRRELGLSHMAEAIAIVARFLRLGEPSNIRSAVQRHSEHARFLLSGIGDPDLELAAKTLEPALAVMANSSIWSNTSRLSEAARGFAQHLAEKVDGPVSELWFSQREALRQSLLDPVKAAISIEMPTSAGKTLLAELAIVQTLALNPDSSIAYVVPTRALVNQITRRLRADIEGAALDGQRPVTVESAVPVLELDPLEEGMLRDRPDVLVTTPEKLDLLVRAEHPAVAKLSLIVVDEAHHISEEGRGPRLELLLATLKRERGQFCRFLLLTPFLPNASELARWLGEENNAVVRVNWKPAEQLRASVRWRRSNGVYSDVMKLLPSQTQSSSWDGTELVLGVASDQDHQPGKTRVSASAALALARREGGGVLVLTKGPGTAETRARDIVDMAGDRGVGDRKEDTLVEDAASYVSSELGDDFPLAELLREGVGFHHAGLPPEVRSLVEVLLERDALRIICGTTTLAQGVNFPLSSVIVEILKVPQGRGMPYRALTYAEFWNIAGRAGRALKDPVGLVLYPAASPADENIFREYLKNEARDVVSALAEVLVGLDESQEEYGLKLVRNRPALSQFLQYLAHALRVAGYDRAVAEVEEILRSSLAFHRLERNDRASAEQLIRWSTGFLERSRGEKLLGVADVTGLSLPSVGLLNATLPATARDRDFWDPEHLFGEDLEPLTKVVELLAEVPEMSLAPSDEEGGINARRVAGILRDWVAGKRLPEITQEWYSETSTDTLQKAGRYLFRSLTSQLPWGMSALQALSGVAKDESSEARRARQAPAMAYYGVSDPDALALRMVGVPRAAAAVLGRDSPGEFESFGEARSWVAGRPAESWREADRARGLDAGVLERVWRSIGGGTA